MEIVDNVIIVAVPGAMEAGLGDVLFWGSLSVALVIAGTFAFPVNRWLIARGKGHAPCTRRGSTAGPDPRGGHRGRLAFVFGVDRAARRSVLASASQLLIGAPGFEPGTSPTRTVRATRLRYAPRYSG